MRILQFDRGRGGSAQGLQILTSDFSITSEDYVHGHHASEQFIQF
jgi:hypothetical protein